MMLDELSLIDGVRMNLRPFKERNQAMNWQDRISIKPEVCHGKACIKGTRVMVSVVLANVAAGEPFENIMSGYHIAREDIQAALFFAADLAQDRYLSLPEAN